MKREMMIGLAVGVAAVAIAAIAMGVGRGSKTAAPVVQRPKAVVKTADALKKQRAVAAAMAEAQRAYSNKNYQVAIDKAQAVLKDVDSTSQEAKNLIQVAQLSQRGEMPVVKAPEPEAAPLSLPTEFVTVTNEETAAPAQT